LDGKIFRRIGLAFPFYGNPFQDTILVGKEMSTKLILIAESWLGLSEQLFGFDKWNVCRV
jgi:hypothetical protein